MNFFDTKNVFQGMYPDKIISFDFDEKCQRKLEIILSDGTTNRVHYIEHDKVRVSIEGMQPIYVPIYAHRITIHWKDMKNLISSKPDPKIIENM